MKNLIAILSLLVFFTGTVHAQINRYQFPRQIPRTPPVDLRFNCADLAVQLSIHQIVNTGGNDFNVVVKATFQNVGRVNFNNSSNPAVANLRVSSNYPGPAEDASFLIGQLRAGESRVTYLTVPWSTNWSTAPNILFSVNTHPDDCNRNNNRKHLSHQAIVQQYRFENLRRNRFGRF